MNNTIKHRKRIVKYKHMLFGIIILLSGILIGFAGGVYTIGHHMDFFRHPPKRIKQEVAEKIIDDFPNLESRKDELDKVLGQELKRFKNFNEEVSYRILQLQHSIAENIAEIMPTQQDKERWMHTFPEYFPGHKRRLPRARRFEERLNHEPGECIMEDWGPPPPPPRPRRD